MISHPYLDRGSPVHLLDPRTKIPADGAVPKVDGIRWRVSWGRAGRRLAMPSWLAPELGGKLRAP